jgi:hypothetical protein
LTRSFFSSSLRIFLLRFLAMIHFARSSNPSHLPRTGVLLRFSISPDMHTCIFYVFWGDYIAHDSGDRHRFAFACFVFCARVPQLFYVVYRDCYLAISSFIVLDWPQNSELWPIWHSIHDHRFFFLLFVWFIKSCANHYVWTLAT